MHQGLRAVKADVRRTEEVRWMSLGTYPIASSSWSSAALMPLMTTKLSSPPMTPAGHAFLVFSVRKGQAHVHAEVVARTGLSQTQV